MMKLRTTNMLKLWRTQSAARTKRKRTRRRRPEKMIVVEWQPGSEKKTKLVKCRNEMQARPRPCPDGLKWVAIAESIQTSHM